MAKAKRDEVTAREQWIQERLGDRKYRQLRMHLSGALRLLGELAATHENRTNLRAETTQAMAALTERLRALSPRREALSIRQIPGRKGARRRATPLRG
jgi:hypothetical protein